MVFGSSPALAPSSKPSENDAIILHGRRDKVGKMLVKWAMVHVMDMYGTTLTLSCNYVTVTSGLVILNKTFRNTWKPILT